MDRIAFFDTHRYERQPFLKANLDHHFDLDFLEPRLTAQTAILAANLRVVCSFVNDRIDLECLLRLKAVGVELIALRSAGYNHVDIDAAEECGIRVARVPAYSPQAVAEFAIGLLLSLNRKIHRAAARVHDHNFSLEGLMGFELKGKTVGVIGAGRIGKTFARIVCAFGCRVLAADPQIDPLLLAENPSVSSAGLDQICREADIISLHAPLTPQTWHILDRQRIFSMKDGVFLLNTGRGALIDSRALIDALKVGKVGAAALDVYEEEEGVFFKDLTDQIIQDDVLARLLTFPNVLVTSHQAFLTEEALNHIAQTTLENIDEFFRTGTINPERLVIPNQQALPHT